MSTFEPKYSGAAASITITLASLANGSYRQSAGIDNTTNLYQEQALTGKIKSGASGVSATGYATLYAFGYDGTQYSNNASGSDAAFTPDAQGNLQPIATIGMTANATTYYLYYLPAATAAGWPMMANKVSFGVGNFTSAAFDATGANSALEFQGLNTQSV